MHGVADWGGRSAAEAFAFHECSCNFSMPSGIRRPSAAGRQWQWRRREEVWVLPARLSSTNAKNTLPYGRSEMQRCWYRQIQHSFIALNSRHVGPLNTRVWQRRHFHAATSDSSIRLIANDYIPPTIYRQRSKTKRVHFLRYRFRLATETVVIRALPITAQPSPPHIVSLPVDIQCRKVYRAENAK